MFIVAVAATSHEVEVDVARNGDPSRLRSSSPTALAMVDLMKRMCQLLNVCDQIAAPAAYTAANYPAPTLYPPMSTVAPYTTTTMAAYTPAPYTTAPVPTAAPYAPSTYATSSPPVYSTTMAPPVSYPTTAAPYVAPPAAPSAAYYSTTSRPYPIPSQMS